jgi:hypothetical protein
MLAASLMPVGVSAAPNSPGNNGAVKLNEQASPSESPTASPSESPTASPSESPTASPSESPTASPSESPSESPSPSPTAVPTPTPAAGELVIFKVNNKGTSNFADDTLLAGASFSIYLDNGNKTFEPGADALVSGPDKATDGILSYHGLRNGRYWVVEVVVPKGFTGTGPIAVLVDSAGKDCLYDRTGLLTCAEPQQGGSTAVIVDNTPEKPHGTGGVGGATGTPRMTLPPTDALRAGTQSSSEGWRWMLVVMAAVLSSILVLTPRGRRRRN